MLNKSQINTVLTSWVLQWSTQWGIRFPLIKMFIILLIWKYWMMSYIYAHSLIICKCILNTFQWNNAGHDLITGEIWQHQQNQICLTPYKRFMIGMIKYEREDALGVCGLPLVFTCWSDKTMRDVEKNNYSVLYIALFTCMLCIYIVFLHCWLFIGLDEST